MDAEGTRALNRHEQETCAKLLSCLYSRDVSVPVFQKFAERLGLLHREVEESVRGDWERAIPPAFNQIAKNLGFELYRYKFLDRNASAPRYVIAFRGTLPHFPADLLADVRIGLGKHNSQRVQDSLDLVLNVIKEIQLQGARLEQIRLTGHSLGAEIALLIGMRLKRDHNIKIDTLLFHPPKLTFASIAALVLHGEQVQVQVQERPCLVSRLTMMLIGAAARKCSQNLSDQWEDFQNLQDYVPRYFLNPEDPICAQQIKFYKERHQSATMVGSLSLQGCITNLVVGGAEYFGTAVPSADLIISERFPHNILLAHGLSQWWDPENELELFPARLLDRR